MADKPIILAGPEGVVFEPVKPRTDGTEEEILKDYFMAVEYNRVEIPDWIKEKYPFEYAKLTILNERYNYLLEEDEHYDH